jgi:hypothetical protein
MSSGFQLCLQTLLFTAELTFLTTIGAKYECTRAAGNKIFLVISILQPTPILN